MRYYLMGNVLRRPVPARSDIHGVEILMGKVWGSMVIVAWALVSAGWCADGDCCRSRREEAAVREKIPPPLGCQLELVGQPKAGRVQNVQLIVQNRFHAGTLRVRLRVPEPLRPEGELKQPSPVALALGEEKQMLLPVAIPVEGQYRLEAVVSLETAEGSQVSSGAVLMVGLPPPKADGASIVEATRPNGRRLRIHQAPPSKANLEKDH